MSRWKLLLGAGAALAVVLAFHLEAPPTPAPSAAPVARTPDRAPASPPVRRPESPSSGESGPTPREESAPLGSPAVQSHATRAAPRWRRSADVLDHAEPAAFAQLARELADRIEAASTDGIDAPHLQELIVEERQLIDHLQRRYEGVPELEGQLAAIEESLAELEDSLDTIGPSPDPRER